MNPPHVRDFLNVGDAIYVNPNATGNENKYMDIINEIHALKNFMSQSTYSGSSCGLFVRQDHGVNIDSYFNH